MDDLSQILDGVSLSAEVFFSGALCKSQPLGGGQTGHLHMLEQGQLSVHSASGHRLVLTKPSILFIPGPIQHTIVSSGSSDARIVCALIHFDSPKKHALIKALPSFLTFDLCEDNHMTKTAKWLFSEAQRCAPGQRAMLNKLSDIFVLQALRHVLTHGQIEHAIFSGLAHPELAKVMSAIHQKPDAPWTLNELASMSAMSRAKFAEFFRETVGQTPLDYITDIRLALAKDLLKQNKSVNFIANHVGYEHGSALARAFRKKIGLSPKQWLGKRKT